MCQLYHISKACKEAWPEQEALIFTLGEILIDLRKEQRSTSKGSGSLLKWQEMQMNEWIREQF